MRNTHLTSALRCGFPLALAGSLLILGGCATEPIPREQLAVSRAAVERVSGPAAAEAPVNVAAARDKVARANVALAEKNYTLARQLAQEAEADATLAEAQARATRSGRALDEVRESLRALQTELNKQ